MARQANATTTNLRYSSAAFKFSHNSYDRDEQPIIEQLLWSSKIPSQAGCRGLELDLYQASNLWVWSVSHMGPYNGLANHQFGEYLMLLRDWSDKNSRHDVITVYLDIKNNYREATDRNSFPWHLDAYIKRYFGAEKLFTPAMLQGEASDLVSGAKKNGWPTLGELRGRFILCLSGTERVKAKYAGTGKERLCFADVKFDTGGQRPNTSSGKRVFFNFNVTASGWERHVRWFAKQPAFVTRGYTINDGELWKHARDAGINILATNKVRKYEWATIGAAPFGKI